MEELSNDGTSIVETICRHTGRPMLSISGCSNAGSGSIPSSTRWRCSSTVPSGSRSCGSNAMVGTLAPVAAENGLLHAAGRPVRGEGRVADDPHAASEGPLPLDAQAARLLERGDL